MPSSRNEDFITLARVVKTQGRKGEVAVEVHSDVPDRFQPAMRLWALAEDASSERHELRIEEFWPHKGLLVIKFAGVDSISQAEALLKSELQVRRSERAPLDAGWNFISDLVGCSVLDHGSEIGRLEDVQFGAGEAPLLVVASSRGMKFDIPFAEAYLEAVDVEKKQIRMALPDGMLDVNAPLNDDEKRQQHTRR